MARPGGRCGIGVIECDKRICLTSSDDTNNSLEVTKIVNKSPYNLGGHEES